MAVIEKELRISNALGLHGRASAKLAETASRFASDIRLLGEAGEVDAKSILDVMSVACGRGAVVKVRAVGPDAEAAVMAIEALVRNKFDEE